MAILSQSSQFKKKKGDENFPNKQNMNQQAHHHVQNLKGNNPSAILNQQGPVMQNVPRHSAPEKNNKNGANMVFQICGKPRHTQP